MDHVAFYLEKKKKGKIALPVFDGWQRDGCPAPQVAQIARLSPNVGRFVVASVARIFFDDAHHQISNVWAVQVIEESDLELVGNPSGNEKKGRRQTGSRDMDLISTHKTAGLFSWAVPDTN
jgi:hypothetical protein